MYKASDYHIPVLYQEVIENLAIKPDGFYVDCTAGGGAHSLGILEQLSSTGLLISIDQDPEALAATKLKLESLDHNNTQFILVHDKFSELKDILAERNIDKVDGILADLGVSSHQIDTARRGFSYRRDGALDMRMNPNNPVSAADLINTSTEEDLVYILKVFGEERYANLIARSIVEKRNLKPFETTMDLVELIKSVMPARSKREKHPARRTFQALRIAVNQELKELEKLLEVIPHCLNNKGRVNLISFHSLEDRIIKNKFQEWENPCTCPNDFPICVCGKKPLGKIIHRKGIVAGKEDIAKNSRARSARLRVFEMN
ncbi:MAG: 16S rRNA (cytosine(1402)-N(4))-methyltransferase RsmH [Clostridiaceae bacterium]|jgi:16S rRNA (cytosine1402-N4)-methyltransferase|nr:16S rRNA (cytosine(1402)-N(4))-methyltransferase RsmH [Clostridiaceae bacterium]